jgi:phasin family protein
MTSDESSMTETEMKAEAKASAPKLAEGARGAAAAARKGAQGAAGKPAQPAPIADDNRAPQARRMMETPMQQVNKAAENVMKATEQAAEFGRGNVEAVMKATQIYVAGVQDLGRQTFAMVQGLTDQAMDSAKALSGVKNLQEAAQLQTTFARAAIEKSMAEGTKIGEASLKLAEQALAPLNARVTAAAERLSPASFAG